MDELVGLAAVQQSSDGRKRIQDDGLRVVVNVVLKHNNEMQTLFSHGNMYTAHGLNENGILTTFASQMNPDSVRTLW